MCGPQDGKNVMREHMPEKDDDLLEELTKCILKEKGLNVIGIDNVDNQESYV